MRSVGKSIIAAFVATVFLSIMMVAKSMMGIMPQLDIASMLASMLGAPGNLAIGWLAHFMIGTIGYGLAFAFLGERLPGGPLMEGVVLALIGWLVMMIMVMPLAGAGLFALGLGIAAPVMTLMLHIIFGAVLGAVYKAISEKGMGGEA